jgi:hypothetical protein
VADLLVVNQEEDPVAAFSRALQLDPKSAAAREGLARLERIMMGR